MSAPLTPEEEDFTRYPGARLPDRMRTIVPRGVSLAVYEWGDEAAPPLLLAHGGFDFAKTFCTFAPFLADAGWRVVAWDQRGHGDSGHVPLYAWDADARDALDVLDSVAERPVPLVGHSKGGSLLMQVAQACPHRVSHLVNIDGMPTRRPHRDVADHERTRLLAGELSDWLDHRRSAGEKVRRPGTLEELAKRRARMNPRLEHAWLCFLVTTGARKDPDGWRWKIDPVMRMGGFGPWRPEWAVQRLPGLSVPLLGMLATEREEMGWDTTEKDLAPYLPPRAKVIEWPETGHFIHIERPREVAQEVLDFLS